MHRLLLVLLLCGSTLSSFAETAAEFAAAGRAARERDDDAKAAELFEKAIAADPKNAEYHFLLGVSYGDLAQKAGILKQAGLAKKTKAAFERAIQLDPNHTESRFALISYYLIAPGFMGGSDEKANEQAAEIKKRNAFDGHRAYARIHRHNKKPELARKEMVEAVREQPNSPKAHYYLGNNYFTDDMYAEALHEYEYALKLDSAYMPAVFRIGVVAAETKTDHARGEASLKKYLAYKPAQDEPSHASAWFYLGKLYENQGRKADAKQSYAAALKLVPGAKDVKEALKRVS
ncbi:MAG TPA: tetratricopeptide repeat protein [Thermoanaerobaculia bacterium]|nr:tetratricopeptide repeat protein [Thermoanaerobaculia bacterium]